MMLDEPGKSTAEQPEEKDAWVKTSVFNIRKQVKLPAIPKQCSVNGQYELATWQVFHRNVKTWADIQSKPYSKALDKVYMSPQEVYFPEFCDFLGEGGRELDEALGGYIYNELPQAIKKTLIRPSDYEVNGTASGAKIMHFIGSKLFRVSKEVVYNLHHAITSKEPVHRPSDIEAGLDQLIQLNEQLMRHGAGLPDSMLQMAMHRMLSKVFEQWPQALYMDLVQPVTQHIRSGNDDVTTMCQIIRDGCFNLRQHSTHGKLMDKSTPTPNGAVAAGVKPGGRYQIMTMNPGQPCTFERESGKCNQSECKGQHGSANGFAHKECTNVVYKEFGVCPAWQTFRPGHCKHNHPNRVKGKEKMQEAFTKAKAKYPTLFTPATAQCGECDPKDEEVISEWDPGV